MNLPLFSGRRRGLFVLLVLIGLAEAGTLGAQAFAVQRLFDATLRVGPADGQAAAVAAFLVTAALAAVLEAARRATSEALGQDYASELRLRLFEGALAEAALQPAERNASGRLLPFVGDLSAIRRWVASGLTSLLVGGVAAVAVLLIITAQSTPMGVAIATIMAAGVGATALLSGPVRAANDRLRRRRGGLSSFIGSRLEGAGAVIAMGRLERERAKVDRRGRQTAAAAVGRAAVIGVTRGIARVTAALMLLAALLVGILEVRAGHLSAGMVVAVTGLTGLLSLAVRDLGLAFELWHAARSAQVHIDARLASELPTPRRRRRRGAAMLALERMKLTPTDRPFSATLESGDVIRLVGSVEERSRVLAVLGALSRPWSGRARVSGRALDGLTGRRVARLVGYASARAGLIRGSLGMNLTYRRSASVDEAERVLALCGLSAVKQRLGGLAGEIKEGGANLSPAERQALLIARALIGTPPLLILDEVDSCLGADLLRRLGSELAAYPGVIVISATQPDLTWPVTQTWRVSRRGLRVESTPPEAPARAAAPLVEPTPCPS